MNLSNTTEYAIRILCFMAIDKKELYRAKYLVDKLNISDKYLRRILTKLSKAKLIKSIQGREGGYRFLIPIEDIYMIDVVNIFEDIGDYTGCLLGFSDCSSENPCAAHKKWAFAKEHILEMFRTTSIANLVNHKSRINKF